MKETNQSSNVSEFLMLPDIDSVFDVALGTVLSLPMHPYMTDEEIETVANLI